MIDDPHALQRFVDAQDAVWEAVRAELAAGCKRSHWMWFVFPQLAGLGRSPMARYYGIASRAEALAYRRHPLLGARLLQSCAALRPHAARGATAVLGDVDALKLRSCLTLFEAVAGGAGRPEARADDAVFAQLLGAFYAGERDPATQALLADAAA